jgi:Zn-finger nucleic acid-binding protein
VDVIHPAHVYLAVRDGDRPVLAVREQDAARDVAQGELPCPKCREPMQRFNYRAYDLELDLCEQGHGTWLDAGEEKRVLELMEQRIKDLNRKAKAEAEWDDFLRKLRSPSFFDKVKGLFKK